MSKQFVPESTNTTYLAYQIQRNIPFPGPWAHFRWTDVKRKTVLWSDDMPFYQLLWKVHFLPKTICVVFIYISKRGSTVTYAQVQFFFVTDKEACELSLWSSTKIMFHQRQWLQRSSPSVLPDTQHLLQPGGCTLNSQISCSDVANGLTNM